MRPYLERSKYGSPYGDKWGDPGNPEHHVVSDDETSPLYGWGYSQGQGPFSPPQYTKDWFDKKGLDMESGVKEEAT